MHSEAAVGILAWENELEQLPGNLIHPDTFPFPVHVERVIGADYKSVVVQPTPEMATRFAEAALKAQTAGARILISTTGLSVIFQKTIVDAVSIPVMTSSLLMLPFFISTLNTESKIGIITASKKYLTQNHLVEAGVGALNFAVVGIDHSALFDSLAINPKQLDSVHEIKSLSVSLAHELLAQEPALGLIVIEVTGLCVAAGAIRCATGLPVLDMVECACFMHNLLNKTRW